MSETKNNRCKDTVFNMTNYVDSVLNKITANF